MSNNPAPLSVFDLSPFVKSGEDITQPLLTAISNLPSTGAISIPFGTYLVTGQISNGNKKVKIIFNGSTLRVNSSFTGSMFYNDTTGGKLTLENGILDGNKASYTITGYGINIGSNAISPLISNMTLQNFPNNGGNLYGTGDLFVINSSSNNNDGVGWFGKTTGNVSFHNCNATGNTGGGGAFSGTTGTEIVGGNWSNNTVIGLGPYWGNNGVSFASNVRVIGTNCSNNDGTGLAIGQGIVYATVVGNTCTNNTILGINIDTVLNDGVTPENVYCSVVGNTVTGGLLPIRWNGAIGGCIVGNTIIDPTVPGNGAIYILGSSNKVQIDSNTLIGTYSFIQIQSGSTAVIGSGNTFIGLSSSIAPVQGSGIIKQATSYWSENTNTTFGNVFPADLYDIDTTSASFTKTLPDASVLGNNQRIIFYKKVAANSLTIQLSGTNRFYKSDGTSTTAADTYTTAGPTSTYVSINDGSNVGWFKIPSY